MIADPRRGRVLLIHPDRCLTGGISEDIEDWRMSASLLEAAREIFGIGLVPLGECGKALEHIEGTAQRPAELNLDPLGVWPGGVCPFAIDETGVIFVGGAWLEEDVLLTAIRAASFGYDVRLLMDLSRPRRPADRWLAIERLAMHGIPTMTLRQALLEWAVFTEDEARMAQVRALLV